MDEIAISPRARWSSTTNEILGFCYNHRLASMTFDNEWSVKNIERKYKNQDIHLAREALCVTLGAMSSNNLSPKPIAILPVCSHTFHELEGVMQHAFSIFKANSPNATIVNIATDGDHFRRKLFNSLRRRVEHEVFSTFEYFDLDLV